MFRISFSILLIVLCFTVNPTVSQVTHGGGKGMLRIYEADTITPGNFYVNSLFQAYATRIDGIQHALAEFYTLNAGLTLGLSRSFEMFTHLVPYQDDQRHIWGPPGDASIGLKYAMIHYARPAQCALVAYTTFPTGQTHPVPYATFSSEGVGIAMIGAFSYNFKKTVAAFPLKVTLNVGWKDHDLGDNFVNETDQLLGGFGFKFPVRSSLLYTELTGEVFVNQSDVAFLHNSLRITQGVKFLGLSNIVFDIAADFEFANYTPTNAQKNAKPRFWEDYADWQIMVGATYRWTLFRKWDKSVQQAENQQRKEEQKQDKIRKKRKKVLEELERYKKKLKEEKKKDIPF